MANYPALVNTAWDVAHTLVADWTREPDRWFTEGDFQASLATRLTTAYDLIGRGRLVGRYPETRVWSRVTCEPCIDYGDEGVPGRCFPDVVVWDDIPNEHHPPDLNGGRWPILWTCEIKFNGKARYSAENKGWDLRKMETLIERNLLRYGCWLNIRRYESKGIAWHIEKDQRLWRCEASLPSPGP